MKSSSSVKNVSTAGFSLIELMVTISIVVLVTGIALGRYSVFNSAVLLKSQAYEIALDIRQAQAYGVSASAQTADERSPFGIYFRENEPQLYRLYQDTSSSGAGVNRYNSSDEIIGEPYTLDPRFEIKRLCAGTETNCVRGNGLSVEFRRPNFNALIWNSVSASVTDHQYMEIEIGLSGNDAAPTRKVIVTSAGLITVE